jgi:hypothetical protein
VASKPNYGFEKRKKEQERKEKQEAKLLRRKEEARLRAEQGTSNDAPLGDAEESPPEPAADVSAHRGS